MSTDDNKKVISAGTVLWMFYQKHFEDDGFFDERSFFQQEFILPVDISVEDIDRYVMMIQKKTGVDSILFGFSGDEYDTDLFLERINKKFKAARKNCKSSYDIY